MTEKIRNKIKEKRTRKNISIRALANMSGVSKTTIVNFEQGHFDISVGKLIQLAHAMDCDVKLVENNE